MKRAAIIVGYNRPRYFERLLWSLRECRHTSDYDWFISLDGGINQCFDEYQAIFNRVGPGFDPEVWWHPKNYGCERHTTLLRMKLFDDLDYDEVAFLEDDIELAPSWFQVMQSLVAWGCSQGLHFGAVNSESSCWLSYDEKMERIDWVSDRNALSNNYYMLKRGWEVIRTLMYEWMSRFLMCRWEDRDIPACRAWIQGVAKSELPAFGSQIPIEAHTYNAREHFLTPGCPVTGVDGMTEIALKMKGLCRLTTNVNRHLPFGEYGIHTDPVNWKKQRLDEVRLHELPLDGLFDEFKLKGDPEPP